MSEKFHRGNKAPNANRKVSIIMSGAIRTYDSHPRVCPARLLAVGHDAILIGIVVFDLDSSPSLCSLFLSLFHLPLRSTNPYSVTYLVIESESIFIYEDCRGMGNGHGCPFDKIN